jgi:hypothetical protein
MTSVRIPTHRHPRLPARELRVDTVKRTPGRVIAPPARPADVVMPPRRDDDPLLSLVSRVAAYVSA